MAFWSRTTGGGTPKTILMNQTSHFVFRGRYGIPVVSYCRWGLPRSTCCRLLVNSLKDSMKVKVKKKNMTIYFKYGRKDFLSPKMFLDSVIFPTWVGQLRFRVLGLRLWSTLLHFIRIRTTMKNNWRLDSGATAKRWLSRAVAHQWRRQGV